MMFSSFDKMASVSKLHGQPSCHYRRQTYIITADTNRAVSFYTREAYCINTVSTAQYIHLRESYPLSPQGQQPAGPGSVNLGSGSR